MTRQLVLAVAAATGESPIDVRRRGFTVHAPDESVDDLDGDEGDGAILALDCPFCGTRCLLSAEGPNGLPELAECDACDVQFDYRDDEAFVVDPNADEPAHEGRHVLAA